MRDKIAPLNNGVARILKIQVDSGFDNVLILWILNSGSKHKKQVNCSECDWKIDMVSMVCYDDVMPGKNKQTDLIPSGRYRISSIFLSTSNDIIRSWT